MKNKLGNWLILLGILGITASVLADIIRGGRIQIQAAQILIIEMGASAILLGLFLKNWPTENAPTQHLFYRLRELPREFPLALSAALGFLITYLVFFITPMFFGAPPRILYYNKYLPDRFPIGSDLHLLVELIQTWMKEGRTPFHITLYPPLTYVFLSPLTLFQAPETLYATVSIVTILCFILAGLIIPLLATPSRDKSFIILFAVTGLLSYGFQFELERGQFNIFAFALALSAVYIYHFHHNLRHYSYVLFSLAIQLKIYPAILIVTLVRDWREWQRNLLRFFWLGAANFLLLFVMGWNAFVEFLQAIVGQLKTPGWAWTGNHSIKAFVSEFTESKGYGIVSPEIVNFVGQNNETISNLLLLVFLICFLLVFHIAYRENHKKLDARLLLISVIGALIIPVSNDYTLPILAGPMAITTALFINSNYGRNKIVAAVLLIVLTSSYSSILYPFKYKALFLQNSFPMLLLILISSTLLTLLTVRPDPLK